MALEPVALASDFSRRPTQKASAFPSMSLMRLPVLPFPVLFPCQLPVQLFFRISILEGFLMLVLLFAARHEVEVRSRFLRARSAFCTALVLTHVWWAEVGVHLWNTSPKLGNGTVLSECSSIYYNAVLRIKVNTGKIWICCPGWLLYGLSFLCQTWILAKISAESTGAEIPVLLSRGLPFATFILFSQDLTLLLPKEFPFILTCFCRLISKFEILVHVKHLLCRCVALFQVY